MHSMNPTSKNTSQNLFEDALGLPDAERADLAALLIDSLDRQIDEDGPSGWASEIARRLAELDRGAVKLVPWPEARRRIMETADGSSGP